MQLELNFLKVENIYSIAGQIMLRKRVPIQDDSDAMAAITKFITDNVDYINAAITNKELVNKLTVVKTMSPDEFNALNYILADSGLFIAPYIVSDVEIDADGIPENTIEYNVVDKTSYLTSFIPYCSKIAVNKDEYNTSAIYEKIVNMYGLFMDDLFSGINPIMSDIKVMKEAEQLVGSAPEAVIAHTNSILEFLDKQIKVIVN